MTVGTCHAADKHLRQRNHLLRVLYSQSRRVKRETAQAHESHSKSNGNDTYAFEITLADTISPTQEDHETLQIKETEESSQCTKSVLQPPSTNISKRRRSPRIIALQEKAEKEITSNVPQSNALSFPNEEIVLRVYSQLYSLLANQWHPTNARCSSSPFGFTIKKEKTMPIGFSKQMKTSNPFKKTSFIPYKIARQGFHHALYVGRSSISAHFLESLDVNAKKSEGFVNNLGAAYEIYTHKYVRNKEMGGEDIEGLLCQEEMSLEEAKHPLLLSKRNSGKFVKAKPRKDVCRSTELSSKHVGGMPSKFVCASFEITNCPSHSSHILKQKANNTEFKTDEHISPPSMWNPLPLDSCDIVYSWKNSSKDFRSLAKYLSTLLGPSKHDSYKKNDNCSSSRSLLDSSTSLEDSTLVARPEHQSDPNSRSTSRIRIRLSRPVKSETTGKLPVHLLSSSDNCKTDTIRSRKGTSNGKSRKLRSKIAIKSSNMPISNSKFHKSRHHSKEKAKVNKTRCHGTKANGKLGRYVYPKTLIAMPPCIKKEHTERENVPPYVARSDSTYDAALSNTTNAISYEKHDNGWLVGPNDETIFYCNKTAL